MENNINEDGIQLEIKKVPINEANIPTKVYPLVEEMTFKGIIKSEEEGYALLRAIQILVNGLGTDSILQIVTSIEKNPQLLQKVKIYLHYINIL